MIVEPGFWCTVRVEALRVAEEPVFASAQFSKEVASDPEESTVSVLGLKAVSEAEQFAPSALQSVQV